MSAFVSFQYPRWSFCVAACFTPVDLMKDGHPERFASNELARKGYCEAAPGSLGQAVSHGESKAVTKFAVDRLAESLCLTPRQAEVLHWVAEGKTNSEISTILGCSFFTVKNHMKGLFQRLGVHSRTAAAAVAYRAHISAVEPERRTVNPG